MSQLSLQPAFGAALGALPGCLSEKPVGVAVSGGGDSLALLVLAHRWAQASGKALTAITVDHGLRKEAKAEAETVARLCRSLGIDHDICRLEGVPPRQSALRRGRHAALAQTLRRRGGRLLLTGHTADDQAETFLMRARQGSGWYGLAGMRALSLSPVWPEGEGMFIARPLLGIRRSALREFLKAEGVSWADDPSNENPAFERVRMRRLFCPDLSRIVPVLTAIDRFETLRCLEDVAVWRWLGENVSWSGGGLNAATFDALPPERAARILGILLQIVADRETPPRGESLARLAHMLACKGDFLGATLGGVRIRARRNRLHFQPEAAPSGQAAISRQSRRLAATAALLSGVEDEIAAIAGNESFLEDLVPIF